MYPPVYLANKLELKLSASITNYIKEPDDLQIKTMRYHLIFVRMAIIK